MQRCDGGSAQGGDRDGAQGRVCASPRPQAQGFLLPRRPTHRQVGACSRPCGPSGPREGLVPAAPPQDSTLSGTRLWGKLWNWVSARSAGRLGGPGQVCLSGSLGLLVPPALGLAGTAPCVFLP